jgi:hypothetical protein
VNRRQKAESKPSKNAKQVLRIMQANKLHPGTAYWTPPGCTPAATGREAFKAAKARCLQVF